MLIIALGSDDWAVFRQIRLAALADAPHAFSSTLAGDSGLDEAGWRARLAARTQFVARDADGSLVGTAGAYRREHVVDLISMWVAPAGRRRGVGAALVERIVDHARAIGCRAVELEVAEDNPAARRLYERHGFVATGKREPMTDDSPRMQAELQRLL